MYEYFEVVEETMTPKPGPGGPDDERRGSLLGLDKPLTGHTVTDL